MSLFTYNIKMQNTLSKLISVCNQLNEHQGDEQVDETDTWSDDDPLANPYASDSNIPSPADEHVDEDEANIAEDFATINDLFDILIGLSKNYHKKDFVKQLNQAYNYIDNCGGGEEENPYYDDVDEDIDNFDNGMNILDDLNNYLIKKRLNDSSHPFPESIKFYNVVHNYIEDCEANLIDHPYFGQWNPKLLTTDYKLASAFPCLVSFSIKFNKKLYKDFEDEAFLRSQVQKDKKRCNHFNNQNQKLLTSTAFRKLKVNNSTKHFYNHARYACYKKIIDIADM